jgi:hypothetical protein
VRRWKARALAAEFASAKTSKTVSKVAELSQEEVLKRSLKMQLDVFEMQKQVRVTYVAPVLFTSLLCSWISRSMRCKCSISKTSRRSKKQN